MLFVHGDAPTQRRAARRLDGDPSCGRASAFARHRKFTPQASSWRLATDIAAARGPVLALVGWSSALAHPRSLSRERIADVWGHGACGWGPDVGGHTQIPLQTPSDAERCRWRVWSKDVERGKPGTPGCNRFGTVRGLTDRASQSLRTVGQRRTVTKRVLDGEPSHAGAR